MDHAFEWQTREEKDAVVRYWWRTQQALCHICKGHMEPYSAAAISPWAATIEHLIPRRENGPNTVGNVRLAHRWCNNVLGALWEMNRHRALKDLPPLSPHWALTNELGKLTFQGKRTVRREPHVKVKLPSGTLASMLASGKMPLPRGATLPGAALAIPAFERSVNKPARRMTPLETARWLRESAERSGRVWRLA